MTPQSNSKNSKFYISDVELKDMLTSVIKSVRETQQYPYEQRKNKPTALEIIRTVTPYIILFLGTMAFLFKTNVYGGMEKTESSLNDLHNKYNKLNTTVNNHSSEISGVNNRIIDLKEFMKGRFNLLENELLRRRK